MLDEEDPRAIEHIRLPTWGRVVAAEGVVPWRIEGDPGGLIEPVDVFLRDFVARGRSAASVRSYALALLRWWRFLLAVDVAWDEATSAEVRDFVLWLGQASKPIAGSRKASATSAGQINPVTRKRHQGDEYTPATIRHSNAVLRSFYEFWIERGHRPLVNPVVRERPRVRRPHAHHNPLEPFVRRAGCVTTRGRRSDIRGRCPTIADRTTLVRPLLSVRRTKSAQSPSTPLWSGTCSPAG